MGYSRAGFDEIVGVDTLPQKYYPFEFVQADALEYLAAFGQEFDAIHASPPCQRWTSYARRPNHVRQSPDLIDPIRQVFITMGCLWVIENIAGAPLESPIMLCGSMFDPPMAIRRHRFFESNIELTNPIWPCRHRLRGPQFPSSTNRRANFRLTVQIGAWNTPEYIQQTAMGIYWMPVAKLSQAIPPAYTQYIGKDLLRHLGRE